MSTYLETDYDSLNIPLCFSGGSSKLPLHWGFLGALANMNVHSHHFLGNSAGSIVATCAALGMSMEEIKKVVLDTDFQKIASYSLLDFFLSFFKKNYVNDGTALYNHLDKVFQGKTFADLPQGIDLTIMASNTRTRSHDVFTRHTHSEMKLAQACRISTSIPFFFKPVSFQDTFYIDGGLAKDYPIDLLQEGEPVIGHLISSDNKERKDVDWVNASKMQMVALAISFLTDANRAESRKDKDREAINITSYYPISMIDFDVSEYKKWDMFRIGANSVIDEIYEEANRLPGKEIEDFFSDKLDEFQRDLNQVFGSSDGKIPKDNMGRLYRSIEDYVVARPIQEVEDNEDFSRIKFSRLN